jgi:hypothetical protein
MAICKEQPPRSHILTLRLSSLDFRFVTSGAQNRRRYKRITTHFRVRFEQSLQAKRAVLLYSKNFSAGGMCLRSRARWVKGVPLTLKMTVEGLKFDLRAEVVWQRASLLGVKFVNVAKSDRLRLVRLLRLLGAKEGARA